MDPEIRYARTSDGVSIAYVAIGSGPLLIDPNAPPFCHAELIWRIAELRPLFEAVAQRMTYVRYDSRGFGMSDRDISDFSLASMVLDLEAVADALAVDRFAIGTWAECAMPALAYAAAHQERVLALALRDGFGSGALVPRHEDVPLRRPLPRLQLERDNWELFTRAVADRTQNILSVSGLRQMHELIKRSASQETFIRYAEQWQTWDVFDVLSNVTVPVLVTNDGGAPKEASRRLAAALPNGSFVSNDPPRGERSPSEAAIAEFFAHALFGMTRDEAHAAVLATARALDVAAAESVLAGEPAMDADDRAGLTPREIEVLRLVVAGRSGREITAELVLSPRTVERHVANIYRKTETHGRAQLAGFALRRNLT